MTLCENWELALRLLPKGLFNTIYMVLGALFFAVLIGLPLGIILLLTRRGGLHEKTWLYKLVGLIVNIGRSIPFAILIVAVIPFTRWVVGTSIGTTASIVPLTLAAAPFFARLVEGTLHGVDSSLVEAAVVMGSTNRQIVQKVLLPEALPSLIQGGTLTAVTLIGYSAMAGLVGGGGLGKVAIQYGYQRFNGFLMVVTLVLLLLLVEGTQALGTSWVQWISKKRGKQVDA
ncbi:MAG: D-methionine transport system permease protein MetI [Chlamydiae bacterium]|nr:D-methionine transport system permease protein MetI [Chlamydiota bacterium]